LFGGKLVRKGKVRLGYRTGERGGPTSLDLYRDVKGFPHTAVKRACLRTPPRGGSFYLFHRSYRLERKKGGTSSLSHPLSRECAPALTEGRIQPGGFSPKTTDVSRRIFEITGDLYFPSFDTGRRGGNEKTQPLDPSLGGGGGAVEKEGAGKGTIAIRGTDISNCEKGGEGCLFGLQGPEEMGSARPDRRGEGGISLLEGGEGVLK